MEEGPGVWHHGTDIDIHFKVSWTYMKVCYGAEVLSFETDFPSNRALFFWWVGCKQFCLSELKRVLLYCIASVDRKFKLI